MDALYLFRHSDQADLEILYSLRSVAKFLPFIRKVWIFGDRPQFLTDDTSLAEHVPHEYLARAGQFQLPVRNMFLSAFLTSLHPEMDFEYLRFSDDYVILDHVSENEMRKVRYIEDLRNSKNRGKGLWRRSLWNTYETLSRMGYPGYNFEIHMPVYQNKKWVFEAYCELKNFVSEDRYFGMLANTAILNHAHKHHQFELTRLHDEGLKVGFYRKPPEYEEIVEKCAGMRYLNFDDKGFSRGMRRFLAERFPEKSKFEKRYSGFVKCGCTKRFCRCAGHMQGYEPYYQLVLNRVKPTKVLEWGPGLNTEMALRAGANQVISVEHNRKWLPDLQDDRFSAIIAPIRSPEYVNLHGHGDADLFFVDGRRRTECIDLVWQDAAVNAVVCLDDAQRDRYHSALEKFPHVWFLSRSFAVASRIDLGF